jgi:hypothetical protein
LRELDLLRFLAAFAVLLFHFTGFNGAGPWPEPAREMFPELLGDLTAYGYLGVDLFFMISGFVILMSAWGRGVGEFGASRLVRLMPAYWAAVLLGAVLYLVFATGRGTWPRVIPNLTMKAGLGVAHVDPAFWTLWIELHFYVLIAGLSAIGISYRSTVAFMAAWLFLGVFADGAEHQLLREILVPTWSPYFIAGMALFLIYRFGSTLLLWGFVAVSWLLSLHYGAWRRRPGRDGVRHGRLPGDDPGGAGPAQQADLEAAHRAGCADLPDLSDPPAARLAAAGTALPGDRRVGLAGGPDHRLSRPGLSHPPLRGTAHGGLDEAEVARVAGPDAARRQPVPPADGTAGTTWASGCRTARRRGRERRHPLRRAGAGGTVVVAS